MGRGSSRRCGLDGAVTWEDVRRSALHSHSAVVDQFVGSRLWTPSCSLSRRQQGRRRRGGCPGQIDGDSVFIVPSPLISVDRPSNPISPGRNSSCPPEVDRVGTEETQFLKLVVQTG